jgi:type II secretory pathway component PulM
MGGAGLRERARMFLQHKNRAEANKELQETRAQLAALQEQMRELVESKRKRKEE